MKKESTLKTSSKIINMFCLEWDNTYVLVSKLTSGNIVFFSKYYLSLGNICTIFL